MIRGIISSDGSPGRVDMSVGDQLRQRAAMGGERERAELAAFEALLSKCIADAVVAQLRKEADAHGVDVLTWLARDKSDKKKSTRDPMGLFEWLAPGLVRVNRLWSLMATNLQPPLSMDDSAKLPLGYSNNAAHRLTGVTDAKGNSVAYTLNTVGNKTGEQVKDPSGNLQRNITRVYDALNWVQ
jgi:YD repeat-containing protein